MTIFRCENAMKNSIHIAAAAIVNVDGRTLLVRKAGTSAFMQAGGKIDSGETADSALRREIREELGCELTGSPLPLGIFRDVAANEAETEVVAEMFLVSLESEPQVSSEIEELIWVTPDEARPLNLAPLTRNHVLPFVESLK